jgi:hypothetical protein
MTGDRVETNAGVETRESSPVRSHDLLAASEDNQ